MDGITIRHATVTDAPQIAAIHCASWRDAYADVLDAAFLAGPVDEDRRTLWESRLNNPDECRTVLLAETEDGVPVAFACAYRDADPVWGSLIDNIHVNPHLRGNGLGHRLVRTLARTIAIDAEAAGVHLWVFEANTAALRFYQRLGGEVVERTSSDIPAALSAPALRLYWADVATLAK